MEYAERGDLFERIKKRVKDGNKYFTEDEIIRMFC
jgi:hypothetical protein